MILPLFALANAGVTLPGHGELAAALVEPVGLGIVVGKQVGVTFGTWLATRVGLASLPQGVSWRQIYGASWLAGIGFTVSLFIVGLAFGQDGETTRRTNAKLAILIASVITGTGGWLILRWLARFVRRSLRSLSL